jgi:predicted AAA+ superfamily ATPase
MPALHVVGAGSLLELALAEIPSLGVGRLSSLFMYPLTFEEFIMATGEGALLRVVEQADAQHPVDEPFHRRLVDLVKTYQLVGGMPAAVKSYAEKHDLSACLKILDDLVTTFEDDFKKYKKRAPVGRLSEVFRSIVLQAGDLELVNRGSLAEVLTGLELIGNQPSHLKPALHYWHRETRGSNAEVDYVIQQGAEIVPVEVKAGTKGQMQSLYRFMDERELNRGIRVSLDNFGEHDRVQVVPLYAACRLARHNVA